MKRRIISIFLTMCLLVSLVPMVAEPAHGAGTDTGIVLNDTEASDPGWSWTISGDVATLTLDGFTWNGVAGKRYCFYYDGAVSLRILNIELKGINTITDNGGVNNFYVFDNMAASEKCNVYGTGSLSCTSEADNGRVFNVNQTLTISDCTITAVGYVTFAQYYATNGTLALDGCDITIVSRQNGNTLLAYNPATINIGNGVMTGFKQDGATYQVEYPSEGRIYFGYDITFNKNTTETVTSMPAVISAATALPTSSPGSPKRTGYDFAGWYMEAACSTEANWGSSISGATTLYAKWTPAKYTLNLSKGSYIDGVSASGTGVTGSNGTYSVPYGGQVSISATPKSNSEDQEYGFGFWSKNSGSTTLSGVTFPCTTSGITFTMPAGNVSLTANGTGGVPAHGKLVMNPYTLKGNCAVTITLSGNTENRIVTLNDSNGNAAYTLTQSSITSYGGSLVQDGATYKVFVDGVDTGKTVQLNGGTATATAQYYTYTVMPKLDGAAYTSYGSIIGISKGGVLLGNGTNLPAGSYAVYVDGEGTGKKTLSTSGGLSIDYYSVTFEDGLGNPYGANTAFAKQVVYGGQCAVSPDVSPSPSAVDYYFTGWKKSGTAFDFTTPINEATTLIADWTANTDAEAKWIISGKTYYGTLQRSLDATNDAGGGPILLLTNAAIKADSVLHENASLEIPENMTATTGGKDFTVKGTIENGGTISGSLENTGTITGGLITGNAKNSGLIKGTTLGVSSNAGGTLDSCTITAGTSIGGIIKGGTYAYNGVSFSGADAENATVNIQGGASGFAGLAPKSGGKNILGADIIVRSTVTASGEIDLNDHKISGANGQNNSTGDGQGGTTPVKAGSLQNLAISGRGSIIGGDGGSAASDADGQLVTGTPGNGGVGGHGIDASAGSSLTINTSVTVVAGAGGTGYGSGKTGGHGGCGVHGATHGATGSVVVTALGTITGGNGGPAISSAQGGDGGDCICGGIIVGEGDLNGGERGDGRLEDPVNGTGGGTDGANDGKSSDDLVMSFAVHFALDYLKVSGNPARIVENGDAYTASIESKGADISLPDKISVFMGGKLLSQGTGYTYDQATGKIDLTNVNGMLVIEAYGKMISSSVVVVKNLDELENALTNSAIKDIVVKGDIVLDSNITLPSGVRLTVDSDAKLDLDGKSITNNGEVFNYGIIEGTLGGTVYEKPAPVLSADKSKLENLVPGEKYLIGGKVYTADQSGEISVRASWGDSITVKGLVGDQVVAGISVTINTKGGGSTSTGGAEPVDDGAYVKVDGELIHIGEVVYDKGDNAITTIVKPGDLDKNISGSNESVTVIVPSVGADTSSARLVVKSIDELSEKKLDLFVDTDGATIGIKAGSIDTSELMKALGAADPAQVPIDITVVKNVSDEEVARVIGSAAEFGGQIIIPPMIFTVTATFDNKTVQVDKFEAYVKRTVEITAEQAKKITTAVVIEPDGTMRHVPTRVYESNGKWYAEINSRTSSTYVLIYNELSFADAKDKWYESIVNEMGSRKVIFGVDEVSFQGDRGITRAEFAAISVRGLGLPATGTESAFDDVAKDSWYAGPVATAYEYGLIAGRGHGIFDPDANITREEAMAMMERAAKVAGYAGRNGSLDEFTDADAVSDWATDAVRYNVGSGLIVGANSMLRPGDEISRAETATVMLRLLQQAQLVDKRN